MPEKDAAFRSLLIPRRIVYSEGSSENRITIPSQFTSSFAALWGGDGTKEGPEILWLLLVSEGRFRVLSDQQVLANERLKEIRDTVTEQGSAPEHTDMASAEPAEITALSVRLLPARVTLEQQWRLTVPDFFWLLKPSDARAKDFVMFKTLDGFWEIWYADVLSKASAPPLSWP